ncbi:SLT domain protein [Rubellimicrobium mesophilum DSM 19309]|uniref:SLT domain protein n=1 Tax=Rubellimicrobium mesophilum DSM 19309 TaxID=442562 RepID=A0A017HPZ3_9RHOB|nr:lytic transglycosylase domain-containing protein [Rubellimicrobium mesophilum]EYD76238.1 SLT domain protein [Rubellimicrobium mesophilum DSM 19309]
MVPRALCLAALLCLIAVPGLGEAGQGVTLDEVEEVEPVAQQAALRPMARPTGQRCARDGAVCIAQISYDADVCRAIEDAARSEELDPGFFARLLWRESLFDAGAVSPAGAQGIAQFIPATAARRGLADPFNPAEAILASADYLKDLERQFGNLGLAAAAYNAGEERVARYLAGLSGLPGETRAYVVAITGEPADIWRDGPLPSPDYALEHGKPFQDACLAKARSRLMPSLEPEAPPLLPWGVILAAQGSRDAAERQARQMSDRLGDLVAGERIDYSRGRVPGLAQRRHIAQIGRDTRAEAEDLCGRIRAEGAVCMVLRN